MRFELLFSGKLQKVFATVIGVMTLWVFYNLIGRSIWVDEGMLLKSIVESDSWLNYVQPLAFYDQAQPMLISFFHQFVIHFVSLEIDVLRIATLIATLIISAPILYVLYKEKTGVLLPALLFLGFSFSIGFYLTEIKHYAFEVVASFLMITVVYSYLIQKLNFVVSAILIGFITIIGFSTLIPAFVLIAYISLTELTKERDGFFNVKNIGALVIAAIFGLFTFLHMQHLTVYQINNYDAYLSKGFWGDIKTLIAVGASIHGKALTAVTAVIVIAGLFADRKSLFFKFTSIYILIVGMVVIGKLTGVYPIASGRHLIWLAPFSYILILFGLRYFSQIKSKLNNTVFAVCTLIIALQAINVIYKTSTGNSPELVSNNQLYSFLSEQPSSNVVLFPHAQPTLQYYLLLSPGLNKHNYIGFTNNFSEPKDPSAARERVYARIVSIFNDLPSGKFYYLVSHQAPLFSEDVPEWQNWTGAYTESKLKQYDCTHIEVFKGHQAQLLEVECGGVTK